MPRVRDRPGRLRRDDPEEGRRGSGVSTGMLNHYFSNRQDLLTQTLVFVSERTQNPLAPGDGGRAAGWDRLKALLDASLPAKSR